LTSFHEFGFWQNDKGRFQIQIYGNKVLAILLKKKIVSPTMSRESLSGLGILTRNSMSMHSHPHRGSSISILADAQESFQSVDARNWSWSWLRVRNIVY
jgi:hypothetical protein